MDILDHQLDPLDVCAEENEEDKVSIILEETDIVECDADGEAVVEEGLQYELEAARNESGLAYRVVQVNNSQSDEIEVPLGQSVNNAVQVLTSPLNGQFYVISNGNDVFTNQTSRSITPHVATLQIETQRSVGTGMKKRDERRRVTHNEVERRRRDKINNWISRLGKLLPECNSNANGEGESKPTFESQSKGGILARACDYIIELRDANENLGQSLQENERLLQEVKVLRHLVTQLRRENTQLKTRIPSTSDFILGP